MLQLSHSKSTQLSEPDASHTGNIAAAVEGRRSCIQQTYKETGKLIVVSNPTWVIGHSMDPFDIECFSVVENIVWRDNRRLTRSHNATQAPNNQRVAAALVSPTVTFVESSVSKPRQRSSDLNHS